MVIAPEPNPDEDIKQTRLAPVRRAPRKRPLPRKLFDAIPEHALIRLHDEAAARPYIVIGRDGIVELEPE